MASGEFSADINQDGNELMLNAIANQPEVSPLLRLSQSQQKLLGQIQILNQWLAYRLNYLLAVRTGYVRSGTGDPAEREDLPQSQADEIRVKSNYLFAILELLTCDPTSPINGFELARQSANVLGREFNFENAREVVVAIVRETSKAEIAAMTGVGGDTKASTLTALRTTLKEDAAVLRDRVNQTVEDTWLEQAKKGALAYFVIYAVWEYRYKAPIRPYWQRYLKAHKQAAAFYQKKHPDIELILPTYREGKIFDSKNKSPLFY